MNAQNRPYFKVEANEVPDSFRHLIPYVERWAIPCDVTRIDYFEKQSKLDIIEFYDAILPFIEQINSWLDEQPKDVADWTAAAIHFMYCLKAHGEAYQPTEEELLARAERFAEWERKRTMESAVSEAEEAFRAKDYARVDRLLSPFEDKLEKIQATKLALSRKKQ